MKSKIKLLGLIALAALVMFAVAACDEPGEGDKKLEFPSELIDTNWVHTSSDKIEFGTNTVTFIPVSGTPTEYTLRKSESINEGGISQTIFYFGEGDSNTITYRNGVITLVRLGDITKGVVWKLDTGITSQLTQSGGDTVSNPINISANIRLTEANWKAILTEINEAEKYVNLNLAQCTRSREATGGGLRSNGTFDEIYDFSTGKDKIVSLTLPNAAINIVGKSTGRDNSAFSNLNSVSASEVISIGSLAFIGCTYLSSVNFPEVSNIDLSAFYRCTSLSSVSFPKATSIGNSAFYSCTYLSSVSFPKATSIGNSAFNGCTSLSSVSFPEVTNIGNSAFDGCTYLSSVSFSEVTNIGNSAFHRCTSLSSVSFPKATSIGDSAFYSCTYLSSVSFPKATSTGASTFYGCTGLISVSFPEATSIDHQAFHDCTSLISVYLPKATSISSQTFVRTNDNLTITLGANAPTLSYKLFDYLNTFYSKTVKVKVPAGAKGYGTIPATYSGSDTTVNWGNGFRGGGWTGTGFGSANNYAGVENINSNITLTIEYISD